MAQITWRNIDAPDLRGVAALQQQGSADINSALAGLAGIANQQRDLSNLNFNTARQQNTDSLTNQLLGFRNAADLQNAEAQFAPDALKARLGAAYDQGAVNQLLATRPGQLRQDATQAIQLDNLEQQQAAQPYERQFYALLAQNPGQAAQYLQQNAGNFADTRQLTNDLTSRQQQLDSLSLQRAQLAQSRAASSAVNAERQAAATDRNNQRSYATELNQYMLDNPNAAYGVKAAELQKKYDINPLQGNQLTAAITQNIGTLGAATPQQSTAVQAADLANSTANAQFKQDSMNDVTNALISKGFDPNVFALQADNKTQAKDVIGVYQSRLSDPNEATEAYTRIKKIFPAATPATIGSIIEQSLSPGRWGGLADGVTVSFSDIDRNAERAKTSANSSGLKETMTTAQRLIDSQANTLLQTGQAPINEFKRALPKFNITGTGEAPTLNPVIPDYSTSREELRKFLDDRLADPKLNKSTR